MMKHAIFCGLGILLVASPLFVSAQSTSACPSMTKNLSYGSRGSDVASLQDFLISQNILAAGNNTGYFGPLTQAAVQAFQALHHLVTSGTPATTGYGLVGPRTRAAIDQDCGQPSGAQASTPAMPMSGTTGSITAHVSFGIPFTLAVGQTGVATGDFWGVELDSVDTANDTAGVTIIPCVSACLKNAYMQEFFTATLNKSHPFGHVSATQSVGATDYFGAITLTALTANTATMILAAN